jgi:hypothetical protein
MTMTEPTVSRLRELLRNELAATEVYEQAVTLADNDPGSAELHLIHAGHREAAEALRKHVEYFGGETEPEAEGWKRFGFAKDARLAGNRAALEVLKEAETKANDHYEKALMDDALPLECRSLIATTLLPQGRSNVATLERLIKDLSS